MKDKDVGFLFIGAILGVSFILGVFWALDFKSGRQIIEQGCAQYNSTTGNFGWIEKS